MPNPAGFVVFLAGANEFLEYLRELRPEAAILRLRRTQTSPYLETAVFPSLLGF